MGYYKYVQMYPIVKYISFTARVKMRINSHKPGGKRMKMCNYCNYNSLIPMKEGFEPYFPGIFRYKENK